MPRKGENIYHRKDGRWEARYICGRDGNGRAIYKSVYAASYTEARRKKAEAMRKITDRAVLNQTKAGTFATVARDWVNSNSCHWKESTKCRYQEKLNNYILPIFGERELSDVSTKEIEDFIVLIRTNGISGREPLGSSASSMVLTILRQLRLWALKADCQVRYSAEYIKIRQQKTGTRVFSEKEERILVEALKRNMDETGAGVLTSLFTGIRIGELCALKGDNIDLESGILHICETLQRLPVYDGGNEQRKTMIRIDTPKSDGSIRDIPLNPELVNILKPFVKPGTYLLTGDREKFVEPRTMEYRFNSILKKCGLKQAGFHSTRRTFASRCIERGMDPKTLSEILGHASVATTLDLYVRINIQRKAESLNLLSDLLAV